MEGNQGKDFMIIRKRHNTFITALCTGLLGMFMFCLHSCTPDLSDDPIPIVPFAAITINLNLPEYFILKTDGGSKPIDGGVRGIILHRINATTYVAYEQNCSYQPNSACATVEVHASTLFMSRSASLRAKSCR